MIERHQRITALKSIARRTFLKDSAMGLGSIALASLLQTESHADNSTLMETGGVIRKLHVTPRAKRIIFLFMAGGPSHVDLFDPKPLLNEMDGKDIPSELLKDHQQFALIRGLPALKGSPWKFSPHGASGTVISELMPHLATVADDLTVVRSMKTTTNVHDPGVNMMNCGSVLFGRPTLGAWLSYGLGSENSNLPNYIVLTSGPTKGSRRFSSSAPGASPTTMQPARDVYRKIAALRLDDYHGARFTGAVARWASPDPDAGTLWWPEEPGPTSRRFADRTPTRRCRS